MDSNSVDPSHSKGRLRIARRTRAWTRPDLRIWPAYYDSSTQMLCLMVSPPASASPNIEASWHYHPAEIEYTRRFLAVSIRYDYFQDSRPPIDAAPITVLFDTPTLLRCSLPPGLREPVPDTIRPPICATFTDYITTLPQWEGISLPKQRRTHFLTPHSTNYCNRGPSTYWSPVTAATKRITAPSMAACLSSCS
jgi:hypothetical protein